MKIPFFIQEFTKEMEDAAINALRNEQFVGGESISKFEEVRCHPIHHLLMNKSIQFVII